MGHLENVLLIEKPRKTQYHKCFWYYDDPHAFAEPLYEEELRKFILIN